MRVIVVGAGVAGTSLARSLRAYGASATVVADGPGASRCALAMSRPTYLPPEHRDWLPMALDCAESTRIGALVSNYRTGDRVRFQPDWRAWDPGGFTEAPDVEATVTEVGATHVVADGLRMAADRIVVATARPEWGRVTYGVTWWNENPAALSYPNDLLVHHLAPYRTMAAVAWPSGARLGSSSASTPTKALVQSQAMFDDAAGRGWIASTEGWHELIGRRVQRNPWLRQDESGVWTYGGFHRTGYVAAVVDAPRAARVVLAG